MGAILRRLIAVERRTERYLRIILELKRRIVALEQELRDLRSL